ncbi:hypothetical protein [Paenibacillus cremeus]|uniref:C2H2-type domain-containing protein n=1 Tax=Paenibacillus cremeus TaxID=2163881 RepID=A0A559JHQ6_9BACL|nr:hypothetical protein [Paenibacillus cremeus]TVX99396.1 hypothetical protein FPZ49_33865 [Paenibacillus cremeus]
MKIAPYKGRRGGGNVKYFSATGPWGTLLFGVTYTDRKKNSVFDKREFQVSEINTGNGWTRECPDTRDILLRTTGETFEGKRDRGKWLEAVYKGTQLPKMTTASASILPKVPQSPQRVVPATPSYMGMPSVQEGSYEVTIQGPTDLLTVTKRRGEQGLLRDFLMKGHESLRCALCGRDFAPEHLITAHIKKRRHASEAERRDTAIVVPMCVMGCDALFEGGWVGVKDSVVIRLRTAKTTPATEEIISGILGRVMSFWNPQTKPYFEWHLQHHK